MNRKTLLVISAVIGAALAGAATWYWLADRKPAAATSPAGVAAGEPCPGGRVLYWHDPMVPGSRFDKPGRSPFMDMDLVPVCEGEAATDGAAVVTIRPEVVNNLGIRTYRVERSVRARQVTADGYLLREAGAWRVLVDIIERDADWVRPGLPAEVRLLNIPGRTWRASVERVEPDIDIGVRSTKAIVRLTQTDPAFRVGLFAEVVIQAPAVGARLFVPREALIRTARRAAVVRALGEGRFQPVEVVPGEEYGEWVEIRQGLNEGDAVVTSGQFLIDSEASLQASFLRMETREEPAKTAAGRGVVQGVDTGTRRIRLEHEPIPELGWPKMTMDFRVAGEVDLVPLTAGDRVRFELRRAPDPDGMHVITAITPDHRH